MDDRTGRVPRLVVGIGRSRASWWALAWAVGESRRRGMRLLLVNVLRPSALPAASTDQDPSGPPRDPFADDMAYGHALIRAAIDQAIGRMPDDVPAEQQVVCGRPAAELAKLVRGGDLLVLGCRHRGWLRRLAPGSVARACARRTACPVVIVPEPSPQALSVPWATDSSRGHWYRWGPRRGARAAS